MPLQYLRPQRAAVKVSRTARTGPGGADVSVVSDSVGHAGVCSGPGELVSAVLHMRYLSCLHMLQLRFGGKLDVSFCFGTRGNNVLCFSLDFGAFLTSDSSDIVHVVLTVLLSDHNVC